MDLDLAQVRAFVAVVDHGHFGRAAQSLSLSQQALSKRVARLEGGLGRLLVRRRGDVGLTPAGERFLPAARRMLDIADRAVADVRHAPGPPLRVDVWGDVHPPARLMRLVAREHPDLLIALSMRRDLAEAVAALERRELELAFGNVANLERPLPRELRAELVTTDPIAVLVNARNPLARRERLTPGDLERRRVWWPMAGSSGELRGFADEYASSIGATLVSDGANLGVDVLVERVAADPDVVAPVVATWPLPDDAGVRVISLHPTPHYPWYAVWPGADAHPAVGRVLRAARAAGSLPAASGDVWLPRGVRPPPAAAGVRAA